MSIVAYLLTVVSVGLFACLSVDCYNFVSEFRAFRIRPSLIRPQVVKKVWFFPKYLEDISPFCWAIDTSTPGLDFKAMVEVVKQ